MTIDLNKVIIIIIIIIIIKPAKMQRKKYSYSTNKAAFYQGMFYRHCLILA